MIGVDLVVIARIEKFIKRFGENGLNRFLNSDELALSKNLNPSTIAGFWAAKEACAKALGTGIGQTCSFHDMTLFKDSYGAPHLRLKESLKEAFNVVSLSLSITHDGDYAIAVVAIEQKK